MGRRFPKIFVSRQNVRLFFFQTASRIPAVAIGATEHDILLALVAFQATDALRVCFALCLINPVARRQRNGRYCRSLNWNRSGWAVTGFGSTKSQTPKPKQASNSNDQTPNGPREN